MPPSIKRAAAAGTALLVASAALGFAATAVASSPPELASANFYSGPFHVQFTAGRPADAPADAAKGTFVAHTVVGSSTLLTLAGPVTCLDVRGNQLGLFYPVASSDPAVIASVFHGVYIYVTVTNKSGTAGSVNFLPTTAASATSCAPLPGIAPITSGSATFGP